MIRLRNFFRRDPGKSWEQRFDELREAEAETVETTDETVDEGRVTLSRRQAKAARGALWYVTTQTDVLPLYSQGSIDAYESMTALARQIDPDDSDLRDQAARLFQAADQLRAGEDERSQS